MKILMVHPHDLWYDPWTIRILEMGRGLMRRGHEVTLCHLPRREIPAHPPLRSQRLGDPAIFELLPRQQNFIHNLRLLQTLAKDADLIHVQKCFAAAVLPVLWVSRLLNKPIHYDWDDNETAISKKVDKRRFSRFQLAVYERQLPYFAETLTYSSHAIGEIALRMGFPDEHMRHIPVGADIEKFRPQIKDPQTLAQFNLDSQRSTVLYIGQLEGAAHANQLIEAAPRVLAQASNLQFLIVGGGEQLDVLRRQAECSAVRDSICIAGYVPADQVPHIIAAADICVACFQNDEASRAKSPLKIAEYLACGKAIVASRVGDVPWMIEGCGIAVEPENVDALAEGILVYARDKKRRQSDGEKARKRAVEHFTWEKGVETLEELYRINLPRIFNNRKLFFQNIV